MSSAAVSVILLFIVTRALNSASADIYSFAYAIANLFVIVDSFQVRDFQATDIREKYSFDTYFVTSIISNIAMKLFATASNAASAHNFSLLILSKTCVFNSGS